MKFELNKGMAILKRTPSVLEVLLTDLPGDWTHNNEGGNSWSPFDILGHLVHGEITDWMIRAEVILSSGIAKNFEPFDRFAQFESSQGKSIAQLLSEFRQLRETNLSNLHALNLTAEHLLLRGIHPEFGEVSLKELLSTWIVHDLGHIAQICRVMAKQYQLEVGPWIQYLGILKR